MKTISPQETFAVYWCLICNVEIKTSFLTKAFKSTSNVPQKAPSHFHDIITHVSRQFSPYLIKDHLNKHRIMTGPQFLTKEGKEKDNGK